MIQGEIPFTSFQIELYEVLSTQWLGKQSEDIRETLINLRIFTNLPNSKL